MLNREFLPVGKLSRIRDIRRQRSTDADDVITFAINFILNYELHFQLIGRTDVDQITSFVINPPLNANYGSN